MCTKYDKYTYPANGKRQLDPGRAIWNTFTAPPDVCVCVCVCVCVQSVLSDFVLVSLAPFEKVRSMYFSNSAKDMTTRNDIYTYTANSWQQLGKGYCTRVTWNEIVSYSFVMYSV